MSETANITFDAYDATFTVSRKPPTLLVSELMRTTGTNPMSLATFAEYFEIILGTDEYRRFKRAAYTFEGDEESMNDIVSRSLEAALSLPTKSSKD